MNIKILNGTSLSDFHYYLLHKCTMKFTPPGIPKRSTHLRVDQARRCLTLKVRVTVFQDDMPLNSLYNI